MKRAFITRPGVQLLAAALLWILVFAAFLRFGGGGLTLFYEIPPEATGHSLSFSPEGIVRVAESRVSGDGVELDVRLEAVGHGETTATLHWDGLENDSLYEQDLSSTIRALPFGILFDSITWNFSGWEIFTACLSLFLLTAALSVLADTSQAPVNHIPAIGIAQILSFLPMIYFLYRLILQLAAPRDMTIGQRDGAVDAFRKASLLYAAVLAALTVGMPIAAIFTMKSITGADWMATGLKLLSAAAAFLLFFTEKRRKLIRVPNGNTAPHEANEIW